MLKVSNITAGYGRLVVLHALSANFARGRVTAFVGPNGCGKSTLLKAIMGFMPISGGEILLEGQPIRLIGRKALARRIAYLPQECQCPDYMTLGELIELAGYSRYSLVGGPSARDRQLFAEILDLVGLADKAGCQVNSLSGGQRQRAWIAMVLAQEADVILMDEPVNHLDMKYQYAVLGLVRELSARHGKTVIVVLHDLNLASAFADDVVMLRDGKVVAAGPAQETMTAANVERAFDFEADIFSRDGRVVCLPRMSHAEAVAA
ncbi:ABC transporter ATP-binding protein [Rhodomicrobium vannielii ATCC 17100]|uniref:ABC transporter ATP-binding protein n=1 Tax=Rhodomicrobium udaipurense TaxID=1202716 RepID=A0A8I1GHC8_9HYPH|nr:ABC transporter ATP-binding protein [Rhodomicrobium udaipurense]KAI95084.1 ABC transporter [Rhodomicrobium udaipurense JA643]MBJ7533010.1 ABC transporter ATP-binding protein [Rhodomicrobium vannielii ATCC 17100]MBJ7544071.1 ABC transporter ATP-binding protein [Rhodomicrobium udaipurense]